MTLLPNPARTRHASKIVSHSKLFLPDVEAVARGTPKINPEMKPPRWHILSMPGARPMKRLKPAKKIRLLVMERFCHEERETFPNLMPDKIAPAIPKIAPEAPISRRRGFQKLLSMA